MTVIEYLPGSDQAEAYRLLARNIIENRRLDIPEPLEIAELENLAYDFIAD